jgi:hypothetical protein
LENIFGPLKQTDTHMSFSCYVMSYLVSRLTFTCIGCIHCGKATIQCSYIECILLKSKSNESHLKIVGFVFLVYTMSLSKFEIYKCHLTLGVRKHYDVESNATNDTSQELRHNWSLGSINWNP